mgnify:CR=1 FL=1
MCVHLTLCYSVCAVLLYRSSLYTINTGRAQMAGCCNLCLQLVRSVRWFGAFYLVVSRYRRIATSKLQTYASQHEYRVAFAIKMHFESRIPPSLGRTWRPAPSSILRPIPSAFSNLEASKISAKRIDSTNTGPTMNPNDYVDFGWNRAGFSFAISVSRPQWNASRCG